MNEIKSQWKIDYSNKFPIITCIDVIGNETIIDVNEIVNKEIGKQAIKSLEIINKLILEKK